MLGPPGAGKGTQARMLEHQFGIPQIASGDLLRAAVKAKTPTGIQARRYMDRGALVPDETVLKLIGERLHDPDTRPGFILDGFPRTVAQAEALGEMLAERGLKIRRVIALKVGDYEIIKRISGRRT